MRLGLKIGCPRAGVPNLSLTMHPFSNPTDEHVPFSQGRI